MRVIGAVFAALAAMSQAGCSDFLPFPAFSNPLGTTAFVEDIPIAAVARQVQCEFRSYLTERETDRLNEEWLALDENQPAQVKLKLTTDLKGYVNFVGVDLRRFGLKPVADLFTVNNKIPTLGAKMSLQGTVTSEVTMNIAQSIKDVSVQSLYRIERGGGVVRHSDHAPVLKNEILVLDKQKKITGLEGVCSNPINAYDGQTNVFRFLFLKAWLDGFFERQKNEAAGLKATCVTDVTLTSAFVVGVDISAGLIYDYTPVVLLPINGLAGDINPSLTNQISITMRLKDKNCDSKPAKT